MPTLDVQGVGKVQVDDSFLKLPSDQQQKIVEDIASQVRASSVAKDMGRTWGGAAVEAVGNVPASAGQFVKNMAQPFIHPVETAENLASIAKGVAQKTGLVSGTDAEKYADALGEFFMQRYGSLEAVKRTLAHDPVGLAADASMFLTGGGTALARAPGLVGRAGEVAGAVGRAIDPINAAVGGAKAVGLGASVVGGGMVAPAATARADLSRALARDNMTAQGAEAAGQALSGDRRATLADVGGENVRGLTERVAQTPGAGRTTVIPFLTNRQEGQADRIADDLSQLTGTHKSAFSAVTDTMQERAAQSKPLYEAGMNFNARADGDIVKAWTDATQSGWGKAILNSGSLRRNLQSEYGIKDITDAPLMPLIDAWKKAADDLVGQNVRSGGKNTARTISQTRDSVLDIVRQKNQAYDQALGAWAGKSKYLDAIEEGKGILGKIGADELHANLAKLGDSEKEAFRIGAVSTIISKMGNDPAKLGDMTKYLRSPEVRGKVAAIMPTPEAAAAWERRLGFEVQSSELVGQSLRNSATARRLGEMHDAKGIVGDLVLDAFSGGTSHSLLRRLVVGIGNKARDTFRSRTDAELAKLLTRSPQGLSGQLAPRRPLLPPLPYRGGARGAFQAGRASNVGGQ